MQGTLKRLGDTFGFFDTPDGDVYVRRDNLPNDAHDGDRFEFETEDRGGRNPVAVNPRLVSRGAARPARDGDRGRDRPERNREQKITVTILPNEEGEIRDFPEGKYLVIFVAFAAKRGNGPAAGLTVKFFVDSIEVDQSFTTDGSGHTFFKAYAQPDAKDFLINAVVKDGDKEIGVFSQRWKKKEEPKKDDSCKKIKVFTGATAPDGFKSFRVITLTGDDKTASEEVGVESAEPIELRWNGQPHTGTILAEHGHAMVAVRTKDPKRTSQIIFYSVKTPTVNSDPQTLEAWEPKPVKTCKVIKAEVVQGAPGYLNILNIRTLTGEDPQAEGIATELAVESTDVSQTLKIGTAREKTIQFTTDDKGRAKQQVFVLPNSRTDVVVYSVANPDLRTIPLYIRHPKKR